MGSNHNECVRLESGELEERRIAMPESDVYHDGSRQLQDQFDTRRLADRLEAVRAHTEFSDHDRAFIERSAMFFLATADADGRPDCSYKGGLPGFVRVLDERCLAFPDYDGNGMFRSLGNIRVNPHVGLLEVDKEQPARLRMNGTRIFPNCPRYIHKMAFVEPSVYAPRPDYAPPDPEWRSRDDIRDAVPRTQPTCDSSSGAG